MQKSALIRKSISNCHFSSCAVASHLNSRFNLNIAPSMSHPLYAKRQSAPRPYLYPLHTATPRKAARALFNVLNIPQNYPFMLRDRRFKDASFAACTIAHIYFTEHRERPRGLGLSQMGCLCVVSLLFVRLWRVGFYFSLSTRNEVPHPPARSASRLPMRRGFTLVRPFPRQVADGFLLLLLLCLARQLRARK